MGGKLFMQGYSLVSKYKNGATHFLGNRGIHLSALAMRQFGGEIEIPGYRGLGWEIAGELLSSEEAKFYRFKISEKISWKKFHYDNKKRHINLVNFIEKCVNDVIRVSTHLEMPKMLEYKNEIIQICKERYIDRYIKLKFGSTDYRFESKFNLALNETLQELKGLIQWFSDSEVNDYINRVTAEAHNAKIKGAQIRKKKRDNAATRKRLREEKITSKAHSEKDKSIDDEKVKKQKQ